MSISTYSKGHYKLSIDSLPTNRNLAYKSILNGTSLAGLVIGWKYYEDVTRTILRSSTQYTAVELFDNTSFGYLMGYGTGIFEIYVDSSRYRGQEMSEPGTHYVVIKYVNGSEETSVQFAITIENPVLQSLTLTYTDSTTKKVGEALNLSSCSLVGNYSQGYKKNITGFTTSYENGYVIKKSDVGDINIVFSYSGKQVTQKIKAVGIDRIKVTGANTSFKKGQTFTFGTLVVTAILSDGAEIAMNNNYTILDNPHASSSVIKSTGNFSYRVKLTNTKTATGYDQDDIETTIDYSVYDLDSIQRSGSGNLNFKAGDTFSFDEEVFALYTNGDGTTLDNEEDLLYDGKTFDVFAGTAFAESDIGSGKSVTVSYTDSTSNTTKSFNVGYSIVGLSNIQIDGSIPRYFVGQTFPEEIAVVANFSDSSSKKVKATVVTSPNMATAGTKDVVVSYTEGGVTKTKTYQIEVENVAIVSIDSVVSNPTKTNYKVGETFDKTGLVLSVTYNDGTTGNISPDRTNLDGYTFANADTGSVNVLVTVGTLTNQNKGITVSVIKPTSIALTSSSNLGGTGTDLNEYEYMSAFNGANIKLDVTYSDSSVETNVLPTLLSPATGVKIDSSTGSKAVVITYTRGDITLTLNQTIYVKKLKSALVIGGTLKTSFLYGETFSLGTNITVTAKYEGDHFADKVLTAQEYAVDFNVGDKLNQKSSRTINITYGLASYSYTIKITYLDRIQNVTGAKVSFYEGDYFEFGNATIDAIYICTDGTQETQTKTLSFLNANILCNYSATTRLTDTGTHAINVRFTDPVTHEYADLTYNITVVADTVQSIVADVATEAVEIDDEVYVIHHHGTEYAIGNYLSSTTGGVTTVTIGLKVYTLTTSGVHVVLTDTDSNSYTSETLTNDDKVGGLYFYENYTMFYKTNKVSLTATTLSGKKLFIDSSRYKVDKTTGTAFTTAGTHTIEITYKELTATYSVTVVAHELSSLEVDTTDTSVKTSYAIGDSFSVVGIVVRAVYNSGYKQKISLGANGYSVNPAHDYVFVDSDYGAHSVTITYSNKTTSYNISVGNPTVDYAEVITSAMNLQPRRQEVFDVANIVVKMHYTNGLVKTLTQASVNTPAVGKFYVDASSLILDQDKKITAAISSTPYTITVKSWDYYRLSGTGYEQTNTFQVSVLPSGALNSIYIDGANAKTTYKTGETFTGEGFVIMQKLDDYEGYVPTNVEGNSNVVTDPALGSVLYSAGQKTVKFTFTLNNVVKEATYTISVIPSYSKANTKTITMKIVRLSAIPASISLEKSGISQQEANDLYKNKDGYIWALFNINDTEIVEGARQLKAGVTNIQCYGYVEKGSRTSDTDITIDNARTILFKDYKPPIEGASNITVKFKRTVKGASNTINLCRNILLYGYKTNRNRAFVSVNDTLGYESLDYHSEPINVSQLGSYDGVAEGDLTYFPDTSRCAVGQNSNKIVGEAILNNGYMIILKTDSRQEPTVYFRHCEMGYVIKADGSTAYDANGNQLQEETYPVEPGNIGDGGLSMFGIMNFYGDTIFVTKKGIRGISVGTASSLTDDTKYSTPRSSLIDNKLKNEDLSNATLYKFQDYLILSVDKHLYVGYGSGTSYEWFYFDNIDANMMFEYSDELYFASKDGKLCKFSYEDTYKDYVDKSRIYIGKGGVSPLIVNDTNNANRIVFNYAKYKDYVIAGKRLSIISSLYSTNIYALIGRFINKNTLENKGYSASNYEGIIDRENGYLKLLENHTIESNGQERMYNLRMLLAERTVYLDQLSFVVPTTRNAIGVAYKLVTNDAQGNPLPTNCFLLQRGNGEFVDLDNLESCRISFQATDSEIVNVEKDDTNQTLTCQLKGDHDLLLDLIQYSNQSLNIFQGCITTLSNVKKHYITRPLDFDQKERLKHIKCFSIENDSGLNSVADLGYIIDSSISKEDILQNGRNMVINNQVTALESDLDKFTFVDFTFDVNDMPKQHRSYREIEDVENICFVFRNYSSSNMVLTNLTVEYTIGVKGD